MCVFFDVTVVGYHVIDVEYDVVDVMCYMLNCGVGVVSDCVVDVVGRGECDMHVVVVCNKGAVIVVEFHNVVVCVDDNTVVVANCVVVEGCAVDVDNIVGVVVGVVVIGVFAGV